MFYLCLCCFHFTVIPFTTNVKVKRTGPWPSRPEDPSCLGGVGRTKVEGGVSGTLWEPAAVNTSEKKIVSDRTGCRFTFVRIKNSLDFFENCLHIWNCLRCRQRLSILLDLRYDFLPSLKICQPLLFTYSDRLLSSVHTLTETFLTLSLSLDCIFLLSFSLDCIDWDRTKIGVFDRND